MHRGKVLVLALAAFTAVAVGLTGASGATGQSGRFITIPGGTITGSSSFVPLGLSNKPASYILEMSAKPVALVDAASKDAGHGPLSFAQRLAVTQQIRSQQAPVITALSKLRGALVTARFQGVYNGVAVTLPQREAWKLSSLSGVKAVFASTTYQIATASPGDGIPLTNAPQAWGGLGAFNGNGMKIADIDTGIDYTHADFGGSGSSADYHCALASDTADPSSVTCNGHPMSDYYGPSAPKIKGGIDLVGDAYNAAAPAGSPALIAQPDNNPLDCNGHGTHTAGTAAGFGVDGSGNTYSGPYDANTINNNSFVIPPGVAPHADIYAVRVFGCSGSVDNTVLIAAMNWAFNNGMDVVNMSLGSVLGSPNDPQSVAASNLAAAGVITVLSAGNSGRNPYIVGSPSAGTGALSVAANDSTPSFPAADLTLTKADTTSGGSLVAIDANGVSVPAGPLTIKVIHTEGGVFNAGVISQGCSVADDGGANSLPANTAIVVRRGTCARVAKAIFGQQAGAAAVIMVNNTNTYPPYEGAITTNPDTGIPYTVTIPFVGVVGGANPSTSANGVTLMAADGGTVALASDSFPNPTYLGLASFTSFGPAGGGGLMKPEVTAPGVSIVSAGMGQGNGGAFLSGTSMAAPHASGEALLVKQAHPNWGAVRYWKDAIVNTANSSLVAGYVARGAGAGEIDAYNATHTQVVADGSPKGTASLSFGVQDAQTTRIDVSLPITLHNFGTSKAAFLITPVAEQGAVHSIVIHGPKASTPNKVVVPAFGTAVVTVELIIRKGQTVDPVAAFNDWWASSTFHDAAGLIHFTPINGSNHLIALNVPYYALPRGVSSVAIHGISRAALLGGQIDNAVLTNPHSANGYADWFSWGGSSPVYPGYFGSADLRHVGIQSFPTGDNNTSLVVFGLQTTRPWTTPDENYVEFDVDVNADSTPDYAVVAYDHGAYTAGAYDGQSIVIVYNLHTHASVARFLMGAMFNGTTMELPVRFSDLCTSGAPCVTDGTAITYTVFVQSFDGGADSITDAAPFDVFHPSLLNNGSDTVAPGAVVTDPTRIDPAAWAANPQLGILVFMQNNQRTFGAVHTVNETRIFPLSF